MYVRKDHVVEKTFKEKFSRAWGVYRYELLFGFWAIPLVLLVRLLRPLIHIRFGKLRADRIGHYVYEYALMVAEGEIINQNTIDLFCTHYPICNNQWDKIIRRRSFVRDWVRYLHYWNKAIPFGKKHNIQNNIDPGSRDISGLLEKANLYFNFSASEELVVNEWLEKHNVQKNNFVCLIVRDNAYLPELIQHNHRNTNIETYVNACKMLADEGLTVIRMGKKMGNKFSTNHPNIIDYAFLDDKSDLLDIWLCANCKFCITTGTGIDSVSDVYRKPKLSLNYIPLGELEPWSDQINVPKILNWEENGNYLTLREHLENNFIFANDYKERGIAITDLEEQDLINAFRERNERVKGTWIETKDDIIRQNKFYEILQSWQNLSNFNPWYHPKNRVGRDWLRKMGDDFLN